MAQVKVQTSAPLAGPGLSPGVPPAAMASPGPLGLQPSVNGTGPAPTPACPAPAVGYGDDPVSATSPGPPQENMANPKEKTPMCLVNELARFNRLQPQYKLLSERGPAHAKIFTVQLTLGEQVWEAEGTSIKKAQHSTAAKALDESMLPRPAPRSPKVDINSNPGSITPTVELNGLAMKRGEPAIYRPLDPKPMPNYRANYNFRGMFNQRYHYPVPKIFFVQLSVGSHEFIGEGRTRQAARHNAAMKALQALRDEPIPERPPQSPEERGEAEEGGDASKSEISLVYEIALKRNLSVNFEVLKESGPPHMKSFLTRVTVGEFSAEGEGNSKKLSKKRAALSILQDLKKLPFIPVVEKPKTHYKKRTKTILKTGPDYGQGMNPISRLAQIQQAKKEKEPEYALLSERGMPRRREFIMQVKVNSEVATGTGPNKKVAKRNAAEAMLLQLGYKASTGAPNAPEMDGNKGWNGKKTSFAEPTSNTPKGLLHLSPDVYQEMEASRKQGGSAPGPGAGGGGGGVNYMTPKEMGPCPAPLSPGHPPYYGGSPTSPSPTTTMARELQLNGQSPTSDAPSLPIKGKSPPMACGVSVQPAQQLDYLAHIQNFQAALSALKQLSEQGLDPVDGPVKSSEPCGREDGH
ncbi:double-stranded RNA-binding protein Staufen homolog 2 isoform X2 [Nelusetta ayraudi]|uniref:double-stranded RNA-binding protein Staufen homolog 2 isoform X2 n=1 Tax=Nelusetta ayraudi TaxID=303726 RepID=UPI003F720D3B